MELRFVVPTAGGKDVLGFGEIEPALDVDLAEFRADQRDIVSILARW